MLRAFKSIFRSEKCYWITRRGFPKFHFQKVLLAIRFQTAVLARISQLTTFRIFRNDEGKVNLLEIKCPASRWKKPLTEKPLLAYLVEDKHTKIISLRQSHPIYTQIQICLYVLQLEQCELFIYCSVDRKTFRIKRDEAFLSYAIPSLRSFYFTFFIQELAALCWKKATSTNNAKMCVAKKLGWIQTSLGELVQDLKG